MPFGIGGNKSRGPERGAEVQPLLFSDLQLSKREREGIAEVIQRESRSRRPENWIKDDILSLIEKRNPEEQIVISDHIIGQINSAREAAAKAAAEAANAGQPS